MGQGFVRSITRVLAGLATLALAAPPLSAGELTVLLRYDDFSKQSNTRVETTLFEAARSVGGGVLVGVIPFQGMPYPTPLEAGKLRPLALTSQQIDLLRKYANEGVIEIALHGYSHRNNARHGPPSEVTGLPVNTQIQLIQSGRASLEAETGKPVRVFIPPYDQYDAATLTALKRNELPVLSAGMRGGTGGEAPLAYLPGGPYPYRLSSVITGALLQGHTDALVVIVIHPYDLLETGESLPPFRAGKGQISLTQLREDLLKALGYGNVRFTTVTKLIDGGEDLSHERFLANTRLRASFVSKHDLLPQALHLYPLTGLYYSQTAANRMYWLQISLAAMLYAALILMLFQTTRVTLRRIRSRNAVRLAIALPGLSLALVLATSVFHGFYLASAATIACCLGILAGAATTLPSRSAS